MVHIKMVDLGLILVIITFVLVMRRLIKMWNLSSIEELYAEWLSDFHISKKLYGTPVLVSGVPSVGNINTVYKSDVDVAVLVHPDHLEALCAEYEQKFENYTVDKGHLRDGYFTVEFEDTYMRKVNVRYTIHDAQLRRTLTHRLNETALTLNFPDLAERVRSLKINPDGTKNMSTEKAWAIVLGYEGDPYDYMADSVEVLMRAARNVTRN